MSENVKVIKYTFWLSIIFLMTTYLVSLNIEIGFFIPNMLWLSNSFFLTVFGGMFGSTVVVLICEIKRYFINKRKTEDYFYYHSYYLCTHLLVLYNSLNTILCNADEYPNGNFLNNPKTGAIAELNALLTGDYTTLLEKNLLKTVIDKFRLSDWKIIDEFLRDCDFLKVAILQDKFENSKEELNKLLEENEIHGFVSKKNKTINQTLEILIMEAENCFKLTECLLQKIDNHCGGRYKWRDSKILFEQQRKNYSEDLFQKFLDKNRLKENGENISEL